MVPGLPGDMSIPDMSCDGTAPLVSGSGIPDMSWPLWSSGAGAGAGLCAACAGTGCDRALAAGLRGAGRDAFFAGLRGVGVEARGMFMPGMSAID